uniref:Uncharacterized protein n=1 Tax=Oryza glaberrima TaxID=4538 RepID=I1NN15_ORYGL
MTAETREAAADATAAHGGCGWPAGIAAGMASSAMAQPATSMTSAWSVAGSAGVARQGAQQEVKPVEMETGQVLSEQLRCHTPEVGNAYRIHQAVDSLPQGVLAETLVLGGRGSAVVGLPRRHPCRHVEGRDVDPFGHSLTGDHLQQKWWWRGQHWSCRLGIGFSSFLLGVHPRVGVGKEDRTEMTETKTETELTETEKFESALSTNRI